MNSNNTEKVIIIGSGPAGYTAAIYAARSGLNPLIISGLEPGGQLMITTDVENFPGFESAVQGPWLMDQMQKQALAVGARIKYDRVQTVDFQNFPFEIITEKNDPIKTYSVIISTGASARWLDVDGENNFKGFGISACATCDGFFYKNKHVVVVGGGNTAVEEALYLSNMCSKVTLIHRREKLRAEKILQDRLMRKKNIDFMWNKKIIKFIGTDNPRVLTRINIYDVLEKKESSMEVDGVFVAIGHSPATKIFKNQIPMDDSGYIHTTDNLTKTKIEGVFAAGDVTDKVYRQAVTAAGYGCMSAIEVENFLSKKNII